MEMTRRGLHRRDPQRRRRPRTLQPHADPRFRHWPTHQECASVQGDSGEHGSTVSCTAVRLYTVFWMVEIYNILPYNTYYDTLLVE